MVPARVVTMSLAVLICALLVAPAARAQQASGIAGVVRDTSGGVLPGVTVEAASPALIEKVRTVVSDGEGRYIIVDVRPGTYVVTFTLPGFATVRREGIQLPGGFTATVNAELRVGALEETVTVTGAAPLVDTQNVRRQDSVSSQTLAALPSGSQSFGSLAAVVPGVSFNGTLASNTGSGGVYAENQTVGNQRGGSKFHGKSGLNAQYDGMSINDGKGQHGYVPNAYTSVEMVVETGGISAESRNSSVTFNMIPKEGGNTFSGTGDARFANPAMQSDSNLTDKLIARGLTTPSQIDHIFDAAFTLGGPVKRDRLWFFTSHRLTGSGNQVAGLFYNKTQGTPFYIPDTSRPAKTEELYRSNAIRLTWQVSAKHKVNFFADNMHDDTRSFFSADQAPEVFTHYDFYPTGLYQATWSAPVTSKLLFEAGFSAALGHFPVLRQPGVEPDTISITNSTAGLLYNAKVPSGSTYGIRDSDRYVQRFAVSYVTGSHAFKTGIMLDQGNSFLEVGGKSTGVLGIGDAVAYTFTGPLDAPKPTQITLYANPRITKYQMKADLGIYAQDQWTIKRLTLNAGLRFDYFNSYVPAQEMPAGPFVPARSFAPVYRVPVWKDIHPRIGGSYDLFGNGRTAVKAYLGRYTGSQGTSAIANANNPAETSIASANRTWNDSNGNYAPDCDLKNFALNGECGPISNQNFGKVNPAATRYAEDVLRGWGIRDYTWEVSTEIQHDLGRGISVQGGYYRNWLGNFSETDNLAVARTDYSPYCITAPTTAANGAFLPGGGGYQICGLYDLGPAAFGKSDLLITQASHYGEKTQGGNYFAFSLNGRFARGIRVGGGVDTGRTTTDNCYVVDSPQQLLNCHVVSPFKANTSAKMNWSIPLPGDVLFSGTLQNVQGAEILASYTASNALIAPSLKRNVGSCGSAATCTASISGIPLIVPGSQFEKRPTNLDLRVSKIVRMGRRSLQANLDVYNMLNGSGILQRNNTFGGTWGRPQLIQEPRMFQISAKLSF